MAESTRAPRQFNDPNGVTWRVRELTAPGRPAALYFETDAGFRRVTRYPDDWRELPAGELEILSRGT